MPTKKSTPPPISKGSENPAWLRLLDSSAKGTFTEHHKSLKQLQELRRLAGLTHGVHSTYAWIKKLRDEGKIKLERGYEIDGTPSLKYIFVE